MSTPMTRLLTALLFFCSTSHAQTMKFETLEVRKHGAVVFAEIIRGAFKRGFQKRDAELDLERWLGDLAGQ